MKKFTAILLVLSLLLAGCGTKAEPAETAAVPETTLTSAPQETAAPAAASLPDGLYTAKFDTDSSMFHVNETCKDMGVLRVQGGAMTIHVILSGTGYVGLFPGTAEQAAAADESEVIDFVKEKVTYDDGFTDTAYAFDIPVPVLNEEFDLATIGKKGKWYDHKVSVSDPRPLSELGGMPVLTDGEYTCEVKSEGGTGKNTIVNPAVLIVNGQDIKASITWSSTNIDYMLQDGQKLLPISNEGGSTFEITMTTMGAPFSVVCDTVAMSTPHEIEYQLTFLPETVQAK